VAKSPSDTRTQLAFVGQQEGVVTRGSNTPDQSTGEIGRPPRGVLHDADRGRVDRARSGEPVVAGPSSGRRLPRPGGHRH
jgi:hypothetical protein